MVLRGTARRRFLVTLLASPVAVYGAAAQAQSNLLNSLLGAAGITPDSAGLSTGDIDAGLREALKIGTERIAGQLGRVDGFNADQLIHVFLPDELKSVQSLLRKFGLSALADDVELRLNRAAEAAVPKAKALFWQAIQDMTLQDVTAIYKGPKDAATQYFRRTMAPELKSTMRPVVESTLEEAGAVRAYDALMGEYTALPFVPDVSADLTEHTLDKALDGLFHYLAQEEAAIRENPARRTTDLLRRVFGAS